MNPKKAPAKKKVPHTPLERTASYGGGLSRILAEMAPMRHDLPLTEEQIYYKARSTPPKPADANVESVRVKLLQRSDVGLRKYGVTTERGDVGTIGWLKHAQEEAMDLCIYLEAAISSLEGKNNQPQP